MKVRMKSSSIARRYFGLGAKESALYLDHVLTVQENKERFGRSFDRATTWYSLLNKIPVKKMNSDDYDICYGWWQIMSALEQMTGTIELEDGSKTESLNLEGHLIDRTFRVMQIIFGLQSDATNENDKLEFIHQCLNKFQRQTQHKTYHKASTRVLKMNFADLVDTGNGYIFDSRRAGTSDTAMRWILTAEDGISRILSSLGREQVIVKMDTADLEGGEPEMAERYRQMKEQIFLNGITDIASGKHYLCSAPSASSTRHCDFPFVMADTPQEIYDLWCEITGFTDITDLAGNIGSRKDDGSIYVVFAKLKARIAQNGANSFSTGKLATETVRARLRNAKVLFVPDCKGTISVPYKKITATGVLSMEHPDGTITSERV